MRIRTVKPEFFTHEGIFEAEKSTKLPLRLAFIGLWCAADKRGRFKWEPRRLGVSILPYDSHDFSRVLDALRTAGFIVRYECNGVSYGCIPSFEKHQFINNREKDSDIPEYVESEHIDASDTREPRDEHASKEERKGKEGENIRKGKIVDASPSRSRGSLDEVMAFCKSNGLFPRDAEWCFWKWESNGWKNDGKPIVSWRATIHSWKRISIFPSQDKPSALDIWPEPEREPEPEIDFLAEFNANKGTKGEAAD